MIISLPPAPYLVAVKTLNVLDCFRAREAVFMLVGNPAADNPQCYNLTAGEFQDLPEGNLTYVVQLGATLTIGEPISSYGMSLTPDEEGTCRSLPSAANHSPKIATIRAVRARLNLGLMEAKNLVESEMQRLGIRALGPYPGTPYSEHKDDD